MSSLGVPEAFKNLSDEEFAQLLSAEVIDVSVGITPVLHRIALDLAIMEDLRASFGLLADVIFTIAAYHISTGSSAARGFSDWKRNRHLPNIVQDLEDRDLSRIYEQLGLKPENIQRFIACRIARNKQARMLLSVDSTTIAWECSNSAKARIGKGKKGSSKVRSVWLSPSIQRRISLFSIAFYRGISMIARRFLTS